MNGAVESPLAIVAVEEEEGPISTVLARPGLVGVPVSGAEEGRAVLVPAEVGRELLFDGAGVESGIVDPGSLIERAEEELWEGVVLSGSGDEIDPEATGELVSSELLEVADPVGELPIALMAPLSLPSIPGRPVGLAPLGTVTVS